MQFIATALKVSTSCVRYICIAQHIEWQHFPIWWQVDVDLPELVMRHLNPAALVKIQCVLVVVRGAVGQLESMTQYLNEIGLEVQKVHVYPTHLPHSWHIVAFRATRGHLNKTGSMFLHRSIDGLKVSSDRSRYCCPDQATQSRLFKHCARDSFRTQLLNRM